MLRPSRTRLAFGARIVLLATLLLAACTSGRSAPTISAREAYAKAVAALTEANRVEVVGSTLTRATPAVRFDVRFDGSNAAATLRIGGEEVDVRLVGGARYLETNTAVWSDLGLSSYAAQYANRWLEFPPGPAALLGGLTTVTSAWLMWIDRSAVTRTVFADFVPTGTAVRASAHGVTGLRLSSSGEQLYVSQADFRPLLFLWNAGISTVFHYPSAAELPQVSAPTSPVLQPRPPRTSG